jgi:hypothetical protein
MYDFLDYLDGEEDLRGAFRRLEGKCPWPKVEVAQPEHAESSWEDAIEIVETAVYRMDPRSDNQPPQRAANFERVPYAFRHLLEIGEW